MKTWTHLKKPDLEAENFNGKPLMQTELRKPLAADVSVVVPVYNGERTLVTLAEQIKHVLMLRVPSFEIIFVNDGSQDRSWELIADLADNDPNIRGLNLMHNYGQHNALLAGIQKTRYQVILTIDDDLQHPPEEIPRLLSKLNEGYDVVYGRPAVRNHNIWRNVASKTLKTVLRIVLGAKMGGQSSAFRAFRADLKTGFKNFADARLSLDVLLSWSANKVTHVLVEHNERQAGKSGYTLRKLLSLSFNMLTGYSTLPLRIASGIGLVTALVGLVLFSYIVIHRLISPSNVPGFTFIASEIAFFAGMQLFAIGVIGEYIARLHFRTMGKPPYVIREEVGDETLQLSDNADLR